MIEMDYTKTTSKSFDEAVDSVIKASESKGFKVQHIHDVEKNVTEKGFQLFPLKIIEVCNAKFASQVLAENVMVSLFLPCKINVFKKDGNVTVTATRPAIISQFFEGVRLKEIALEVDRIVTEIVDNSV